MIPRYQIVLFAILIGASAAMGALLYHLRTRAHEQLLAGEATTPTKAPQVAPLVQATLLVANDNQDSLDTRILALPLPPSPEQSARAILGKLMDLYAAEGSSHAVPGGAAAITQVFLLPADSAAASAAGAPHASRTPAADSQNVSELAVVNLSAAFAAGHPKGIETESLTLLSICATLHANLPRVSEVRFLVDGHPQPTLNGHADLTRTYLTAQLTAPAEAVR